jgi:hypothetical protein
MSFTISPPPPRVRFSMASRRLSDAINCATGTPLMVQ